MGARVRVKVPLKVYHVPKVPEVDLTGMEGQIKQYVGVWRGKRISANLPYKVEFLTDIQPRGPVKFFAHLKEDEFEYV
ncbi:ferredoxin--nitrite reductase [Escherichia coli]|nr:ferredoxin--nitrite reductase [Escherichia coli]